MSHNVQYNINHSCAASNSSHNQPRYAHVISRLLCVISAQLQVALWRTVMDSCKHAQCCVVQVLCAGVARPEDIYVYGDACLQPTAVFDWPKRIKEGRSRTEDLALPGCPPPITDPDTCAKVDQMVLCDHRVTLRLINEHLAITLECVHHMSCKF
jgi:hypothetical protein